MERISLFDRLKNSEVNIDSEQDKIISIIDGSYYFKEDLKSLFKVTEFGAYEADFNSFVAQLMESDDINLFLDLCEFLNYLLKFNKFNSLSMNSARHLFKVIYSDVDRLGYVFKKVGSFEKICLKNPVAESVAEVVNKKTSDKIYSYLMIRNGDVDNKRLAIKDLADDFETIRGKVDKTKEFDKLGQFIQCVRHTKDNPKKEFPFYYEDEEKWLDKIYEMLLGAFAYSKSIDLYKEIIEQENKN